MNDTKVDEEEVFFDYYSDECLFALLCRAKPRLYSLYHVTWLILQTTFD